MASHDIAGTRRTSHSPASAGDVERAEEGSALTREVLQILFGPARHRKFTVRFWDGTEEGPSGSTPFVLVLRHPGALRGMLLPPTERALGEAFLRGDFDVEGDTEAAASLAEPIARAFGALRVAVRLIARLRRLPPGDGSEVRYGGPNRRAGGLHSPERDRQAVKYHYDVGNEFYRLWLDERMVYSCGYFPDGAETLNRAQEAKLDLICRKLRLQPGERFLDIGSGWGSLVIHAARHFGVRALGVTLSEAQAELARERIARERLQERCTVEVLDYRELPTEASFHKIASVGMVEHVGRKRLPVYFGRAFDLLEPGGLFLNHGIVTLEAPLSAVRRAVRRALRRWVSFVDRHVFPDGELVSLGETIRPAEAAGFEVRDVENLREHYATTLRHWLHRLEARRDEAVALVGEPTWRIWRLYLAGSAFQFRTGRVALAQTLLARPRDDGSVDLPRSRADLYARSELPSPEGARREA